MESTQEAAEPELINSYALVAYVPGPLGRFLDDLRVELVPSCVALSHVTILPPRELAITPAEAKLEIERELVDFTPFRLELQDVEVFASTGVIYLGISAGADQLREMHDHLNRAGLFFKENYEYHPHLTLALDFPPQEIEEMVYVAKERWAQSPLPRSFMIEAVTFVQNTNANHWQDLQDFPLGEPVPVGITR